MCDSYQFIKRRRNFKKKLLQNYGNSVAIIPNSTEHIRNSNIYYPYRSNSNFYYLTGFNEPNSCLIMITNTGEDILFCMPNDRHKELWEGSVIGPEAIKELLGFDHAYSINNFEYILPNILEDCKSVFVEMNRLNMEKNQIFSCFKKTLKKNNNKYINLMDIRPTLSEMRLIKDSSEIDKMKQSAEISANAHKEILRYCTVGMYEYELEAKLLYEFNKNGAREVSYKSIIATGANSCTLHYSKNNSIIRSGDLVLIDAGCELDNYASDITRTFPANGKFSSCQLDLYEIVLEAQKVAIEKAIAGNNFRQPHEEALKIIVQGLIDEKILNGTLYEIIENETYKNIFPHSTSHWIGIDVHDVGNQYELNGNSKIWRNLDSGMLLTIEPGIYIRPSDKIPSIFWNTGIRIEDTVLVNKKGNEIISKNAPVNPVAIENIMRG